MLQVTNNGLDEALFNHIVNSVSHTIIYNLLDITLTCLGPHYAELMVKVDERHKNPLGQIHGGLLMLLSDTAMGNAIRSLGIKAVTLDCSTAFIAAPRPGDVLIASGEVIKAGQHILFARSRIYAGETLLVDSKSTCYKTGMVEL